MNVFRDHTVVANNNLPFMRQDLSQRMNDGTCPATSFRTRTNQLIQKRVRDEEGVVTCPCLSSLYP